MSALDNHPAVLLGGLIGSPVGGAVLAYATRVKTACYGSADMFTGIRGEPCTYDYNPAAGAVATVVGWALTGLAMHLLESGKSE